VTARLVCSVRFALGCSGRFGGSVASAFLIAVITAGSGETEFVSCDVMAVARSRRVRHGAVEEVLDALCLAQQEVAGVLEEHDVCGRAVPA
jgi:hypothetical protein